MSFKRQVHEHCQQLVEDQIARSLQLIIEAQTASNNDAKSSMGDKYETNREMMALEISKASEQLQESSKLKRVLSELNPDKKSASIGLGSLIETNIGVFYMSVSLGKLAVDNKDVFALSAVSPLGMALLKKQSGEEFEFNSRVIKIEAIK